MTPECEQLLIEEVATLKRENELLRQKLDLVLRKLFGKSGEALDTAQFELLLGGEEGMPPGKAPASLDADAPEEAASSAANPESPARKTRRRRLPTTFPSSRKSSCSNPVKACPDAWRRIGQEHSDRLDYQPGKIFIHRLERPVFVRVADRDPAHIKTFSVSQLKERKPR